jgi:hypothetical protein
MTSIDDDAFTARVQKHTSRLDVAAVAQILERLGLSHDLIVRWVQWATQHQLGGPEALRQVIERGLVPDEPSRKPGTPRHWGDLRYMLLYDDVNQTMRDLESKRGRGLPRVTIETAVERLRKINPQREGYDPKTLPGTLTRRREEYDPKVTPRWEGYDPKTLTRRYYEAEKRLKELAKQLELVPDPTSATNRD